MSLIARTVLIPVSVLMALCLCRSSALADHDVFLGWSSDSQYFVKLQKKDGKDHQLAFCSELRKPSWPKEVQSKPKSIDDCVYLEPSKGPITVEQAKQLVQAHSSHKGPNGETLAIRHKSGNDPHLIATLTKGKTKIETEYDTAEVADGHRVGSVTRRLTDVFWRPDRKQLAFYIDTNPADPNSERWTFVWNYAEDLEGAAKGQNKQ